MYICIYICIYIYTLLILAFGWSGVMLCCYIVFPAPQSLPKPPPKGSPKLPEDSPKLPTTSSQRPSHTSLQKLRFAPKSPKISKITHKKHEWDLWWSLKKMALTSRKTKFTIKAPIILAPQRISFVFECLRVSSNYPKTPFLSATNHDWNLRWTPQKMALTWRKTKGTIKAPIILGSAADFIRVWFWYLLPFYKSP